MLRKDSYELPWIRGSRLTRYRLYPSRASSLRLFSCIAFTKMYACAYSNDCVITFHGYNSMILRRPDPLPFREGVATPDYSKVAVKAAKAASPPGQTVQLERF